MKYNQRTDRSKELEGGLMQEDQAEKHIDPISGDLFSIAAIIGPGVHSSCLSSWPL